jgi:hypothetical protein
MAARLPWRALAAGALAGATLVAIQPDRAHAAAPSLSFASETCDLGSVVQAEQPDCTFSFVNAGGDDLRILQVEPTCGCTTALLSSPLLHAGERGALRVVFDTENYAGEVAKEIEVRSNDPSRPLVVLQVKAAIEPEIDFEPRLVSFDNVPPGAALRQTVMLTNRRAEPVRLLRLGSQPDAYRCLMSSWQDRSQPLVIESWDRVPIDVRFVAPAALPMAIAGECELEIEGPRKRIFKLKLLALPSP